MKANITIKQIAQESNVSMATVSRYLNGTVSVSEKKRRQIEAVIQKYNFSPNTHARSLISGRTMTLGIVVPDISNPYFYSLFLEIQKEAAPKGYSLLLYNTSFQKGGPSCTEEEYFQRLIQHRVDGALVLGGQIDLISPSDSYIRALRNLGEYLPVVVMGSPVPNCSCRFIDMETGEGVSLLFHYLYSMGHREIAFIGGNTGVRITETRIQTYRNLLEDYGLPLNPDYVVLTDYYAEDGYQAATNLLEKTRTFTAVIAANDNVAMGALRAFADRGYKVPEDFSMLSCDLCSGGNYSIPRMTGVERDPAQAGKLLTDCLFQDIENKPGEKPARLIPRFVEKESCRAL